MKKIRNVLIPFALVAMLVGCGSNNDSKDVEPHKEGDNPTPAETTIGPATFSARKRQEMPTAEIINNTFDYGDPSSWAGDSYKGLDLGYVYLQDVVDDSVYDWGHSVMKEGDTYKMWWVRPATFDAIYYAESKDLKNWVNVQRVIDLSPNATTKINYVHMKGMLGTPSVVKVKGTYYMYFEAPASEDPDLTQTVLEWDNQVLMATSSDGITWDFYKDNKGQPKPVVAMNPQYMADFNNKNYGVGQPNLFYKDGTFYLTYCYVMYDSALSSKNGIYLATSTDGYDFGDPSTHRKISNGNGWGFTFNTKTNKYMAVNGKLLESNELDFNSANSYKIHEIDTTQYQTGFWDFVRNEEGLVDTETFYVIHLMGDLSLTSDWRAGNQTWDGYIHAVNPTEYANREFTLPNGAAATPDNLKGYRNRSNSYQRPSATAAYVNETDITFDGEMDAAYTKSTTIEISRSVYNWGSNFSTSWGLAKVAYNEKFLYVYARVYDETPNTNFKITNETMTYQHDSLDVFVDVPNDHGTQKEYKYGIEQYIICTDSNNSNFCIKGADDYVITNDFSRPKHRVKTYDFGYDIELQIPWFELVEDYINDSFEDEGLTIGLDFQINDAMNLNVGREAMISWSDNSGNAFQYTDGMGDLFLSPKK